MRVQCSSKNIVDAIHGLQVDQVLAENRETKEMATSYQQCLWNICLDVQDSAVSKENIN